MAEEPKFYHESWGVVTDLLAFFDSYRLASMAPIAAGIEKAMLRAYEAGKRDALVPVDELAGKVPVVLYFATKEDANEFAAVIKQALRCPVEIRLP